MDSVALCGGFGCEQCRNFIRQLVNEIGMDLMAIVCENRSG